MLWVSSAKVRVLATDGGVVHTRPFAGARCMMKRGEEAMAMAMAMAMALWPWSA